MAQHCPSPGPKPVPLDDEILVERVRQGDELAFTQLYRRHARFVATITARLMGDSLELEDVVQETFVGAARGLARLEDATRLRAWLATIAVRCVKRRLRARSLRRMLGRDLAQHTPTSSDPRQKGEVDELCDALSRIPIRLRMPWVLARLQGESLQSVAQMCEISLATAKRRLADADRRLERRLHGT